MQSVRPSFGAVDLGRSRQKYKIFFVKRKKFIRASMTKIAASCLKILFSAISGVRLVRSIFQKMAGNVVFFTFPGAKNPQLIQVTEKLHADNIARKLKGHR